MNRREFVVAGAAMFLAACGPAAPPAATTAPAAAPKPTTPPVQPTTAAAAAPTTAPAAAAQPTTAAAAGATTAPAAASQPAAPPADAAPVAQQVLVMPYDNSLDFTSMDFMESVYKRGNAGRGSDLMTESLVRLDKNFDLKPSAALSWTPNSDDTVWTFKLDPNLMWSDDTPLTADDYVATFRYTADPQHAWDFAWFYAGVIKNWDDVLAGKMPTDQLGVTAVDPHTLQFTTQMPAPYLPAMLLYSMGFQKKALDAHGGTYNNDPATSVSAGPYVLKEWRKGDRVIYEANPKYKGQNKPTVQRLVSIGMATSAMLASYQNGEIDWVQGSDLSPADVDVITTDPTLSKQIHSHYGDFRTDYIFMDCQNPPFNNLKVRQAFSHVIDRDSIIKQISKPSQAIPAYSFLMPGFPASNSDGLKDIQNYAPDTAKQLIADAGYPNGQGFPNLTLWLRDETPGRQAMAAAIAASIKQNLGINVDVSNKETKTFTDAMNAKPTQIQFGMVSYGFDFLDPSNMLGVWLGSGRHNWQNAQYDQMVKAAASFTGDPAQRVKMFQDAEKLLVTDVGGIFIQHRTISDIFRPYLKGSELEPDKNGYAAIHWPGFINMNTVPGSLYISTDVGNRKLPT